MINYTHIYKYYVFISWIIKADYDNDIKIIDNAKYFGENFVNKFI